MYTSVVVAALAFSALTAAKTVNITVGDGVNTTSLDNPFNPPNVTAEIGDVVLFTFVAGEFDVVQSTFASPCTHAHISNSSINGFDSGVQAATNSSHPTFPVTITNNDTIWFYTTTLCGEGGVGAINANASSTATLEGFERNAIRLNGTGANETSSSSGPTSTFGGSGPSGTSTSSSSSTSGSTSAAQKLGSFGTVPLLMLALGVTAL